MCAVKPITNAEWTFEVIDGPLEIELAAVAINDILETKCSKDFWFGFKRHTHRWLDQKIKVRIVRIKKIGSKRWIFIGDWLDAKFKDRPCSFKGTYCSSSKTGVFVFDFKYGHLSFVDIDFYRYVSFR